MLELTRAIDAQNELLLQIVAQNADLISVITAEEDDDVPRGLDGKPIG